MFSQWVKIKNTKLARENKNTFRLVCPNMKPYVQRAANEIESAREATEDIFRNFAKTAQTSMDNAAYAGAITRNMPADVATPLPPLNASQIGYACPIVQQKKVSTLM